MFLRKGETGTGGIAEERYHSAIIEVARIVNVNIADWTVDAVSMLNNRRFFDIQVMCPYLHYANGEGIYVVPEVGAICYVAQLSSGFMAPRIVIGFGAPPDQRVNEATQEQTGNFRANRQNFNPGDIVMRTRDENFVILRRGGVVQIGASPTAQRLFIPVGNIIRDMCNSYDLFSLAGGMSWEVDRVDQSDAGEVLTRAVLRAKTHADEPEHAVTVVLGSHKDKPDLRMSIVVRPTGQTGSPVVMQLTTDKSGNVAWDVDTDFDLTAGGSVFLTAGESMLLTAGGGTFGIDQRGTMTGTAKTAISFTVGKKGRQDAVLALQAEVARLKARIINLEGDVNLGGSQAKSPAVLGDELAAILGDLIDGLTDVTKPAGLSVPPGNPMLFPGLLSIKAKLSKLYSQHVKLW